MTAFEHHILDLCRYFGKYKGLWSVAFSTFILLAGFMPFLWAKSAALVAWVGLDPKNEIYVAITYELLESLQVLISHTCTIPHCSCTQCTVALSKTSAEAHIVCMSSQMRKVWVGSVQHASGLSHKAPLASAALLDALCCLLPQYLQMNDF